jgi:nucleotide-binding universal stress UspA family protein
VYTKILVPLDGSKIAEGILPYARTIAQTFKLPVELLHAIDPEVISTFTDPSHGRYADNVEAGMKSYALDYLKPVAASLANALTAHCRVEVGTPADVIVERASAERDTLIAMATHGRSGVQRWLLGSVADKVLHMTTSHLLLARTAEQLDSREAAPLKSIVVPLDGSELAEKVLPSVVVLAKGMSLDVILIRAYELPNALYATDESMPKLLELVDRLKREANSYLEGKVQQLRREGLNRISYVVREGNGAAEIIDFARKTPENLIAMCTHGRSGIRRVLGSVTDRVVRNSWDPVLVMPPAAAG